VAQAEAGRCAGTPAVSRHHGVRDRASVGLAPRAANAGATFAQRKWLLDHMLACGRAAEGIEPNKLATKQIELRLPNKDLVRLQHFAVRELPKGRATRQLSTPCSPLSTRHGIDTSVPRALRALKAIIAHLKSAPSYADLRSSSPLAAVPAQGKLPQHRACGPVGQQQSTGPRASGIAGRIWPGDGAVRHLKMRPCL
jgi:hypothetical protein